MERNDRIALAVFQAGCVVSIVCLWRRVHQLEEIAMTTAEILDIQFQEEVDEKFEEIVEKLDDEA